jgi:HK97 family phage prohead protease
MNRAFVALEIKALDDDARTIEGWATTPEVDRMGDIVLPKGAEYELPIPFLLDHDHSQVVGEVDKVQVTDKGIRFWAHIKKIAEEGDAKSLCDKAWSFIKHGLRKAVSIGFRPLDFDVLPNGGLKFTSWEWYELSAVGIPAQPGAVITGTKSYSLGDAFVAEAPAEPEIPAPPEPAATGKSVRVVKLDAPARDRAPFVINKIHPARPAGSQT